MSDTSSREQSPARGLAPAATPNGLIHFADAAVLVQDAGEEIMELYMNLATISTNRTGLGFLDSSSSLLDFDLVIAAPQAHSTGLKALTGPLQDSGAAAKGRRRQKLSTGAPRADSGAAQSVGGKDIVVPVKVQQDLQLLKASKGDTGSVLWRSSLHLARHLLSQHHFPSVQATPVLDSSIMRSARILELGSGTGLLASLLSPLCAEGTFVASDRNENLRLLYRNLELNGRVAPSSPTSSTVPLSPTRRSRNLPSSRENKSNGKRSHVSGAALGGADDGTMNVRVEEVDWVDIASARKPPPLREDEQHDLVLAVDCIFNESLCLPLVKTLSRYVPVGSKGCALVVVELRSADVLELFLETWLQDESGPWTIVRLAEDALGSWEGERPRWVGWVGWRE